MSENHSSGFQQAIETVERLSPEDQALLIDIIKRHLIDERRDQLATEIAESRTAYERGDVTRGTVEDLMKDLTDSPSPVGTKYL